MRSYRDNIIRILNAYPFGSPGLLPALETICQTAEENGRRDSRDSLATEVCEGLHLDAPKGLKCRKCYEAEQGFATAEAVQAEIDMFKKD